MAEDRSTITVPSISYTNSVKISNIITPSNAETVLNEIENISKVLLTNYSLLDEKGIEYTLFMYKQDFYTIDNKIESYGLSIVDKTIKNIADKNVNKSNKTDFILRIGPSNINFSRYATEYVRLYKLSRMATPQQTSGSSSDNQETVTAGGSRRQEYEQKRRV